MLGARGPLPVFVVLNDLVNNSCGISLLFAKCGEDFHFLYEVVHGQQY